MNNQTSLSTALEVRRFTCLADMHHLKEQLFNDEMGRERTLRVFGSARQMICLLNRLERQTKAVAASTGPVWVKGYCGDNVMSPLAQNLWRVLRCVQDDAPQSLVEGRRLSPWLEVALPLAYEWEPALPSLALSSELLAGSVDASQDGMEQIFRAIRDECTSKEFRAKVNGHTRNAKQSYYRCVEYMLSLFRYHARPLILRVDLYYEGDAREIAESAAARKAEDKFLRALREERIVPNVLRYVFKREDGLDRRIHYHVLVAMDGDKHRDAHAFGELIGAYWVNNCVGSPLLASYFNVWVRNRELEYSCLGHVHYSDADKIEGLRRALWYLCEPGSHVLVHERLGRNLRKGQLKAIDFPRTSGRPRKIEDSLAIAEAILLAPVPAGKERVVWRSPPVDNTDELGANAPAIRSL